MKFFYQFYVLDLSNFEHEYTVPQYFEDTNFFGGLLAHDLNTNMTLGRTRARGNCLNMIVLNSKFYEDYAECRADLLILVNEQAERIAKLTDRPIALWLVENPADLDDFTTIEEVFDDTQLLRCDIVFGDELMDKSFTPRASSHDLEKIESRRLLSDFHHLSHMMGKIQSDVMIVRNEKQHMYSNNDTYINQL